MKKSLPVSLNYCVLAFAAYCIWGRVTLATAQSVTWQILPFQQSDWPDGQGSPASTNGNVIALHGQPVRTVQTFSGGPLKISYDAVLDSRSSTDGGLQFIFVPSGLASNVLRPALVLYFGFRNTPGLLDALYITSISSNGTGTQVWGEVPFSISVQTVYHNEIDVSPSGGLTWIVNSQTNSIPGSVTIPFAQYQLEMESWQPGGPTSFGPTVTVSNFSAVPEPCTAALVTVGLMGMLFYRSKRLH